MCVDDLIQPEDGVRSGFSEMSSTKSLSDGVWLLEETCMSISRREKMLMDEA